MKKNVSLLCLLLIVSLCIVNRASASGANHARLNKPQQSQARDPKSGYPPPVAVAKPNATNCATGPRSSPIAPPKCDDSTFVIDSAPGLDTGCTFRSGGPLVFTIRITRYVGELAALRAKGLIKATLKMPAFDVDFNANVQGVQPERDRVKINGHTLPEEFLTGANNIWKLNEFTIPIEFLNLPTKPNGTAPVTPTDNVISIDIDVANSEEAWCTSIDWAAILIDVPRPVVLVHGIFSGPSTWSFWETGLNALGIPNYAITLDPTPVTINTIQDNANSIAMEVATLRQRWGVDKVNLLCHSKGGLDSRHFVGVIDSNNSVEKLIQIGTPNAGSPLVDYVVLGSFLLPPQVSVPINLVGLDRLPGGYQLSLSYMNLIYNPFISQRNRKVKYTALAGDYKFCDSLICSELPADIIFAILMVGSSDLVVPVSSVHSLSYTESLLFRSTGDNKQAVHATPPGLDFISQTGSQTIFDALIPRLLEPGKREDSRASNQVNQAAAPVSVSGISATGSIVGTTSQGQLRTHTIPIDQATSPMLFTMLYPSGNLDMALISPSGQRFDATTIAGNPNVSRTDQAILGGRMEVYSFTNPQVGIWTVEVTAPSVVEKSGESAYQISGWMQNPAIKFIGSAENLYIHKGDRLRLLGTLTNNGAPITGSTVTTKIVLPDNTNQMVALHDDGLTGDATANDGIYTGDFNATTQAGTYRMVYSASRPAMGGVPAFSRNDLAVATVSNSTSTFSGSFQDFGLDTDGDTLFNNLVIQTNVNVTASGLYTIAGTLTDSQGNAQDASVQAQLGTGVQPIMLKFDGETIFKNRVNGPYTLSRIFMAEESGSDFLPVAVLTNAHQTAAYNFRNFQHSAVSLTGNISSTGIDTNTNGLFDLLKVGIEVDVNTSGIYEWSARLVDKNGKELGFASNSGSLIAGTNTIELTFNGEPIGTNGVDGPYFVSGLIVFGSGGSLVANNTLATSPFSASQFEGSFNYCISDENTRRYLQINSATGAYIYRDCSKNISMSGRGKISISFCKLTMSDTGPDPKRPDRSVSVLLNTCTGNGTATVKVTGSPQVVSLIDSNSNNACACSQ
jgi:pimeloyl-ACP methyl ester carboxylesterase